MWEWLLTLSSLLWWSYHRQRVLLILSTIFKSLLFVYKSLLILVSLVIYSPYSLQSLDCTNNNSPHIFMQHLFQFLPAMDVKTTRSQSKSMLSVLLSQYWTRKHTTKKFSFTRQFCIRWFKEIFLDNDPNNKALNTSWLAIPLLTSGLQGRATTAKGSDLLIESRNLEFPYPSFRDCRHLTNREEKKQNQKEAHVDPCAYREK